MGRGSLHQFLGCFFCVSFLLALSESAPAEIEHPVVINEIMYHVRATEWKEDSSAEFIELYHSGDSPVSLEGWRFASGIRYQFPRVELEPGEFLVIAADVEAFRARHPDAAGAVLGPLERQLSNSGERIALEDADGDVVDTVSYADSGRWAVRRSARLRGYDDWIWEAPHDGDGASLSLISPRADNRHGANWMASRTLGGTPGRPNDVFREALPPVIVSLKHHPAIPGADTPGTVSAQVDPRVDVTLTLFYRRDGDPEFQTAPMTDGKAVIPAMPDGSVVQYGVRAVDGEGREAFFPSLNRDEKGELADRQALCLYQVDEGFDRDRETAPGAKPTLRLITTAAEIALLRQLSDISGANSAYDNHLHATLIVVDGGGIEVRHHVSARMRGHGSRSAFPPGLRVSFPSDDPWRGVTDINLNSQYTHSQSLGAAIHQLAGFAAARSTPVHLRMNGEDWTRTGPPQYGCYVLNEVFDGDYVEANFPGEEDGNMYRLVGNANLNRRGSDLSNYRTAYNKRNHASEDDYSDVLRLIDTLAEAEPAETYFERVDEVADLEQWARYLALDALLGNTEGGLPTGRGDDVAIFRRQNGRFQLIPYDLDSILGMGERGRQLDNDVFQYGNMQGFRYLFQNERFLKLFAGKFIELTETVYRPEIIHRLIDEQWKGWIPQSEIDDVKAFVEERIDVVMSQFRSSTVIGSTLEREGEFYKASSSRFALYGRFDRGAVRDVQVAGVTPRLFPETGTWLMGPDQLNEVVRPGMNQIPIVMRGPAGDVVEREWMRVWLDNGSVQRVSGRLPESGTTTWSLDEGPYLLEDRVVVPSEATLVIEPGVTVYGSEEGELVVEGRLQVLGEPDRRVTFAKNPEDREAEGWSGLRWKGSVREGNVLRHVDCFSLNGSIDIEETRLVAFHACRIDWAGNQGIRVKASGLVFSEGHLEPPPGAVGPVVVGEASKLRLERSEIVRGREGPAIRLTQMLRVDLFGNLFRQGGTPVVALADTGIGYLDGNDFELAGNSEGPVWEAGETVVSTRNRVFGRVKNEITEGEGGNTWYPQALPVRRVPAADVRWVEQPPRRTASTAPVFQVSGHGLEAFRYRLDGGPWSEPVEMGESAVREFAVESLSPGAHRVGVIGRHVSGRWQGEEETTVSREFEVVPGLPSIQISEVLALNETVDGGASDLVELHNFGDQSFDLSGFGLSDDPDERDAHVFPEGTEIEPGGYLVLEASQDQLGFALSGQGDRVLLSDREGQRVDQVVFGLQLPDRSISRFDDDRWSLSVPTFGAANEALDTAPPEALRMAEWLAEVSVSAPEEFLEIKNSADQAVDVGGCVLTDQIPNRRRWRPLPELSFIGPGERRVFLADGNWEDGANHLSFGLSKEGGVLGLMGREGVLIDFVVFGPQATGVSQGRDASGSLSFGMPTPGAVNRGLPESRMAEWIAGLRISELHYHPSTDEDEEFLELVNIGAKPLSLDGFEFVEGISLRFGESTLSPGECAVIVNDRDAFERRYGAEMAILGEYDGKLSNGGERLRLASPDGETILVFEYDDGWHRSTDGGGHSLTWIDTGDSRIDRKRAWKASEGSGGSPGRWTGAGHEG